MLIHKIYPVLIVLCLILSCKRNYTKKSVLFSPKECVEYIIKKDDSLGKIRNHACKKISLSETIKQYTSSLNNLDNVDCPENFSKAFKSHISTWKEMLKVTDNHPAVRGELHDLFDQLEVSQDSIEFKLRLKAIWDTWADVERAIKN